MSVPCAARGRFGVPRGGHRVSRGRGSGSGSRCGVGQGAWAREGRLQVACTDAAQLAPVSGGDRGQVGEGRHCRGTPAPGPGRERQAERLAGPWGSCVGSRSALTRCLRIGCGDPLRPRRVPVCWQQPARPWEGRAGSGRGLLEPEGPQQIWVCPSQLPCMGCWEPVCGAPRSGWQRCASTCTSKGHLQSGARRWHGPI